MLFDNEFSSMKFSEWVTLIGAIVAGFTGVLNLLILAKNRFDRIKVGVGASSPNLEKENADMLHVINCCDRPVKIADYGFIQKDYKKNSLAHVLSIPDFGRHRQHVFYPASTVLKARGDDMDAGYDSKEKVIAVYARTNMQYFLRISFSNSVSFKDKLIVKWKFLSRKNRY
ncbi:MAG: hypothetical protein E7K92_12000 [Serratia marcescens]|nr:hypothetical protein [Serratia marcescens]